MWDMYADRKRGVRIELPEDMFDALVLLYAFGRALVEHLVDRVADDVERPECQGYRHPEQADAGQTESGREQPYSQIAADIVYQRAREREAGEVAVGACCVKKTEKPFLDKILMVIAAG